ncbi:hypothetical protein ALC62_07006 [Cyphomyrmex costatus]|uniref:Uncharacterized protein n=1 Tax=Cyphomyrmex costatus TaxID=456900 RepID=A0A195CP12_9HYME|nr:hypothetical protein ALC62_07006 [Cyphomyrmex costatus]
MIDWVSIVRHSRRRFSDYMFTVPSKIRKHPRVKRHVNSTLGSPNDRDKNNAISRNSRNGRGVCECCWKLFLWPFGVRNNHAIKLFSKTRFDGIGVEEQLPPPPSPPKLKEAAHPDGIPGLNSIERILYPDGIPHLSHETPNKVSVSR